MKLTAADKLADALLALCNILEEDILNKSDDMELALAEADRALDAYHHETFEETE